MLWRGLTHLTQAKFQIPASKIPLLERQRLFDRLRDFDGRKCTIVHAPPGGGKTALLAAWLGQPDVASWSAFWISVDEGDRDPAYFLQTLIAAATLDLDSDPIADPLLFGRAASNALWSAYVEAHGKSIIVIDDFHIAECGPINMFLGALLERMPPAIHIVIASRCIPSFPTARFRAEGQVLAIGPAELKFNSEECLAVVGEAIVPAETNALVEQLEGWPVLVQLVRLNAAENSGQRTATELIDRSWADISNYLQTEIFAQLSEPVIDLLAETVVAQVVDIDIAAAICDRAISSELYEEVLGTLPHLFAVRNCNDGFRHHAIIARYLAQLLHRRGEDFAAVLHRRASDWYLQRGQFSAAAYHMAAIGDIDAVAALIEDCGAVRIALVNGYPELVRLLRLLPADAILKRPRLRLAQAWVDAKAGNVRAARQWCEAVGSEVERLPLADPVKNEMLFVEKMVWTVYEEHSISFDALREMEDIRSLVPQDDQWFISWVNNLLCIMYTRRGDLANATEAASRALTSYRMADAVYGELFMHFHLAMISVMAGQLQTAANHLQIAGTLARTHFEADVGLRAMIDLLSGHVAYEQNDLLRAAQLLVPAFEKVGGAETWVEVHALGATSLAKIYLDRGENDLASACLKQLDQEGERRGLKRLQWLGAHCQFELHLMRGEISQARGLVAAGNVLLGEGPHSYVTWFERERALVSRLRLALRDGDHSATVQEGLEDFVEEAELLGRRRANAEGLLLLAELFHASERPADMVVALERALAIAVPDQMIRLFLDEGAAIGTILKSFIRRAGIKSLLPTTLSFVIRIVAELGGVPDGQEQACTVFSEKELDVLGHLVSDQSNKMIARRLSVSEATVKFHLANIYRKLGVNTRADAKSIARERQLVPQP
jgi:LuxR family maltose regulon positive regulatory protein